MSRQHVLLDTGRTSVGEVRPLTMNLDNMSPIHWTCYGAATPSQGQEQGAIVSTPLHVVYSTKGMDPINSAFYLTESVVLLASSPSTTTWSTTDETIRTISGLSSCVLRRAPILTGPVSDAFEREKRAFLNMREDLLTNVEYCGKFVAVLNGKVVDHDENEVELAKRCYKRYGYVPMYIAKAERTERILEMPSPE